MKALAKRLVLALPVLLLLALSLPALTEQDLFWRMHFTMGSLSHIMRCHERHSMVPESVNIDVPVDELMQYFLDFFIACFADF